VRGAGLAQAGTTKDRTLVAALADQTQFLRCHAARAVSGRRASGRASHPALPCSLPSPRAASGCARRVSLTRFAHTCRPCDPAASSLCNCAGQAQHHQPRRAPSPAGLCRSRRACRAPGFVRASPPAASRVASGSRGGSRSPHGCYGRGGGFRRSGRAKHCRGGRGKDERRRRRRGRGGHARARARGPAGAQQLAGGRGPGGGSRCGGGSGGGGARVPRGGGGGAARGGGRFWRGAGVWGERGREDAAPDGGDVVRAGGARLSRRPASPSRSSAHGRSGRAQL
jgi:hypothetical protein